MTTWRQQARCRGQDPSIFTPDGKNEQEATTEARMICFSCQVRPECLTAALVGDERLGVWGGLDPADRSRLRKLLRADSRWAHLPGDGPHPVQRVVLGLSRNQRRRLLAEERAQATQPLPHGSARRLADRFGVSEASISLDLAWLREQEHENEHEEASA